MVQSSGSSPSDATPKLRKRRPRILPSLILLAVLGTGAFFGYRYYQFAKIHERTDNAQIEATTTPVLARVGGYIRSLAVSDYATVRAGQLLVQLDTVEYALSRAQTEADYLQAQADLEVARANLRTVQQNVHLAQAGIDLQEVRRAKAARDYQRNQELYQGNSLPLKQVEDAKAAVDEQDRLLASAREQLRVAQANEAVAQTNIKKMEAVLQVKRSMIEQADLRLSYTQVAAPVSGKVGKLNVETGQLVQPGQPLFTIVNDSLFWVVANFKETQIGHMREGQEVEIRVDAFPGEVLHGHVASLSEATGARFALLPPDNSSGNFVKVTQRVPVKIALDDAGALRDQLRAGLSVVATVTITQ